MTKSAIKIQKQIFANPADAPAIPPKPKTPAIIATIIKIIIQRNIVNGFNSQ